ncbi:MAG: hypothetical protein IPN67_02525 [Bacteroidales bacterium]|nr:hypothetical protein [Bacteroidales bacterium]
MKRITLVILFILSVLSACKKDDTATSNSGTVTIDNKTEFSTTYYVYGFSFAKAKKVSTLEVPGPDVTIDVNTDNPPESWLNLQANNLYPSFYKIGDYPDAQSASDAFDNLTTVGNYQWTDMAQPVTPNQVWVYRTGTPCYAKIRIISTVNDSINDEPHGECSFEWVFQPDGSSSFPVK